MLALVDGMDAVNYKLIRNLTTKQGYQILLSIQMWALALVNGMDAVNYKQLTRLPNSVK